MKHSTNINPSVETRNLEPLYKATGNLYESISIISKRSNQLNVELKQELNEKLKEFAPVTDNLEEIMENREQIEISRHYERMPNPAILAYKEFIDGKTYFRVNDEA